MARRDARGRFTKGGSTSGSEARQVGHDLFGLADQLINARLLNRIGLAATRRIQQRTRQGVDYQGNRFKDYSAGHAERRRKENLPTSVVDLHFTLYGGSMEHLDHLVANDLSSVEIYFNDPRADEIMGYHNVQGAGRSKVLRKNMGLSEEDVDDIQDLVGEEIGDLLKLANLG